MQPEYLFIRILEACNANCFMCDFALSRDRYRVSADDLKKVLPRVRAQGIRYVRMTGGEPLMHTEIVDIIGAIRENGMKSSVISNGSLLERKLPALVEAGLDQIIVSLDGGKPETHNEIRKTPGLFERATAGLRAAKKAGVRCRVNTVCGPTNFREMPMLQDLLTEIGVSQWELSSLKLERKLDYTDADIEDTRDVVRYVYDEARIAGRLVPMGKVWCGNTEEERRLYFETGSTPRVDGQCLVVEKVRYLDAKNGMLYPCSLLAHRPEAPHIGVQVPMLRYLSVASDAIQAQAAEFREMGPKMCTGCSSSAAGWGNDLRAGVAESEWSY